MTRNDLKAEGAFNPAALDALSDDALWEIVHRQLSAGNVTRLVWLLEENADNALTASERAELAARSRAAELLRLRRAYAATVLRQRGYSLPPVDDV